MRGFVIVAAGLLLLIGGVLVGEALYIGVIAGPSAIEEYRFGSDAMVGHGGWAYRSRSAYLVSGAIRGGVILAVGTFLLSWSRRKHVAA